MSHRLTVIRKHGHGSIARGCKAVLANPDALAELERAIELDEAEADIRRAHEALERALTRRNAARSA